MITRLGSIDPFMGKAVMAKSPRPQQTASAKAARIKATGQSSRIKGHTVAATKRSQAKRDAKK